MRSVILTSLFLLIWVVFRIVRCCQCQRNTKCVNQGGSCLICNRYTCNPSLRSGHSFRTIPRRYPSTPGHSPVKFSPRIPAELHWFIISTCFQCWRQELRWADMTYQWCCFELWKSWLKAPRDDFWKVLVLVDSFTPHLTSPHLSLEQIFKHHASPCSLSRIMSLALNGLKIWSPGMFVSWTCAIRILLQNTIFSD